MTGREAGAVGCSVKRLSKIFFMGIVLSIQGMVGAAAEDEWRVTSQADLQFMHETIAIAHPGVLDKQDVTFQNWFRDGYEEARLLLSQARTKRQAEAALQYYAAGYEDGHPGVWRSHKEKTKKSDWAGWIMQKRGADFVVTERSENWPAAVPFVGTKVISCDGVPVEDYIRKTIAPFTDRRDLDASWQRNAIKVTLDSSAESPVWSETRARECLIELDNGRRRSFPLYWQPYDESKIQTERRYTRRYYSQEMHSLGDDIYWIQASDFQLNEASNRLLEEMLSHIRQLHHAKLVVLDTRGNNGGSSFVGYRILKALLKHGMPEDNNNAHADFRVSDLAIDYFGKVLAEIPKSHGESRAEYIFVKEQRDGLVSARKMGKEWFRQTEFNEAEISEEGPAFGGRLVLLTDNGCGSACLDFADMVFQVPGVMHMGLPTSGDTNYMEVMPLRTPSGLNMWLPLKVWRNRPRGSNQFYAPQYLFDGDIHDTPAVQEWVLKTIGGDESRSTNGK
ncbi:S41 family peptidase [Herbaspirillum sp. NPDC101396]|uniref:S41 family peptidase n=1 Tax=Herbaspirillum sp. NPDC101396 TaxID=3364005 RepID=UPI00383AFAA0